MYAKCQRFGHDFIYYQKNEQLIVFDLIDKLKPQK